MPVLRIDESVIRDRSKKGGGPDNSCKPLKKRRGGGEGQFCIWGKKRKKTVRGVERRDKEVR